MKALIIAFARSVVIIAALFIWCFVFFLWVLKLTRVTFSYSFAIVRYLFSGQNPPDPAYLDHAADFWFRGFREIPHMFDLNRHPNPLLAAPQYSIWAELLVSSIFFLWIVATITLRDYWTIALVWLVSGLWTTITIIFGYLGKLMHRFW